MLKALASKHFVRIQDARGQTSHFTLTTYRQLSQHGPGVGLDAAHASPAADDESNPNEASASTAQGDEAFEQVRQQLERARLRLQASFDPQAESSGRSD